jgi:autotransporter translocation and assembly factor TamB
MLRADLGVRDTLIDGFFNLDIPEIAPLTGLFNQPELTGQVSAAGTLSGHLQNPTLSIAITCRRLHYDSFPIDSVFAQLRYEDSALLIDTGYAFGILKVADSSQAPFGLEYISGTLAYDIALSGRLDSLKGRIRTEAGSLRYQGYSVDSAAVSLSINGPLVQLTDLNIYYGHLRLSSKGEFDLTTNDGEIKTYLWEQAENVSDSEEDSASVKANWISAGQATALFQLLPDRQFAIDAGGAGLRIGSLLRSTLDTLRIDGELGFDLTFTGDLINPFGELSAVVRSIELPEVSLDSLTISVSLLADTLRVNDVELYAYQQKLAGQAVLWLERYRDSSLTFSDDSRFEGSVDIKNFELAVFSPFLTPGAEIAGTGSAKLSWDGKLSHPSAQGFLNVFEARYLADSASVPITGIDVRLTLRDSLVSIDTATAVIEDFPVCVNGSAIIGRENRLTIDLSATLADIGSLIIDGSISSDSMDLKAASDGFRLGVLSPFLKDVDSLDGTLTCDLRASGTSENPEVIGRVNIDDMGLISQEYYTTLHNARGQVRFDSYRIVIDSLTGDMNDGTVLLSGNVTLDQKQITDIDIHLYVSRLQFSDPKMFLLQIDTSHIAYGRRDGNYAISGDIHLGESRLTAGFRPQTILPWARSVETVEWELPAIVEQTKLDIRII